MNKIPLNSCDFFIWDSISCDSDCNDSDFEIRHFGKKHVINLSTRKEKWKVRLEKKFDSFFKNQYFLTEGVLSELKMALDDLEYDSKD